MDDLVAVPDQTPAGNDPYGGDAEELCADVLAGLRWPRDFICPCCGDTKGWRVRRGQWKCHACHRQTSVTAGTILARTRIPLLHWFAAMRLITHAGQRVNDIRSVTARQLQ